MNHDYHKTRFFNLLYGVNGLGYKLHEMFAQPNLRILYLKDSLKIDEDYFELYLEYDDKFPQFKYFFFSSLREKSKEIQKYILNTLIGPDNYTINEIEPRMLTHPLTFQFNRNCQYLQKCGDCYIVTEEVYPIMKDILENQTKKELE